MTVKMLVDWRNPVDGKLYKVGHLLSTDAGTETGLVAANQADSNLTGGVPWTSPAAPESIDETTGSPFILKFPDFEPSVLASLVAGATASRTSGVVTISATGHNITTGATYVGCRFFYPGSANLVAGWYGPIVSIPDANTLTFSAPGPNFSSESINAGAAYTTLTTIVSQTIPGGTLKPYSRITSNLFRTGDTSVALKNLRNIFAGAQLGLSGATTSPHGTHRLTICLDGVGKALGVSGSDGTLTSTLASTTIDVSADQTFSIAGSVSAASGFLALHSAQLEVIV